MASTAYAYSLEQDGSNMSKSTAPEVSRYGDQPSHNRPVDLVHLARQSLGDRSLECEILNLFRSQSQLYIDRLARAKSRDERKMAAHTILGSARGIGAWAVAEEAEKVELSGKCAGDLTALRHALDEANAYIGVVLDDA
ncbi:MAG: histidine kinase [Hyphomicrobiales bacterium]|nr:MAG: histidine kinase [Hyphomicrobiales bacterium]